MDYLPSTSSGLSALTNLANAASGPPEPPTTENSSLTGVQTSDPIAAALPVDGNARSSPEGGDVTLPPQRRTMTLYPLSEKLKIIERIKTGETLRSLQKETGIDRKVLRQWRQDEYKFRQAALSGDAETIKRVHSGRLLISPVLPKRNRRRSGDMFDAAPELKMEGRTIARAFTANAQEGPPVLQHAPQPADAPAAVEYEGDADGNDLHSSHVDQNDDSFGGYDDFPPAMVNDYHRLQFRIMELRAQNMEMDLQLKADEHKLKCLDIKMKEIQLNRMKQEEKRAKVNCLASKLPQTTDGATNESTVNDDANVNHNHEASFQ